MAIVLVGLLTGGLCGAFNGFLVTRTGIPPYPAHDICHDSNVTANSSAA